MCFMKLKMKHMNVPKAETDFSDKKFLSKFNLMQMLPVARKNGMPLEC